MGGEGALRSKYDIRYLRKLTNNVNNVLEKITTFIPKIQKVLVIEGRLLELVVQFTQFNLKEWILEGIGASKAICLSAV